MVELGNVNRHPGSNGDSHFNEMLCVRWTGDRVLCDCSESFQVIRKGCSEREIILLIYQHILNRELGVNFFLPSGGKCVDFKGLSCNGDLSFLPEIS